MFPCTWCGTDVPLRVILDPTISRLCHTSRGLKHKFWQIPIAVRRSVSATERKRFRRIDRIIGSIESVGSPLNESTSREDSSASRSRLDRNHPRARNRRKRGSSGTAALTRWALRPCKTDVNQKKCKQDADGLFSHSL